MRHLSGDSRIAIGILLLLILVTIFAALQRGTEQQYPALSSASSAPDGALALKLWFKELQYEVDEQILENFIPPQNVSILFMLEPLTITESEMQAVDDWVEAGGTLIAFGGQYSMYAVVDH